MQAQSGIEIETHDFPVESGNVDTYETDIIKV